MLSRALPRPAPPQNQLPGGFGIGRSAKKEVDPPTAPALGDASKKGPTRRPAPIIVAHEPTLALQAHGQRPKRSPTARILLVVAGAAPDLHMVAVYTALIARLARVGAYMHGVAVDARHRRMGPLGVI